MARITVTGRTGDQVAVRVTDGGRDFDYTVEVPAATAERFGAGPERVAGATLAFLLDREPPTSIMARFGPDTVTGYFPEYPDELPGYLARADQ